MSAGRSVHNRFFDGRFGIGFKVEARRRLVLSRSKRAESKSSPDLRLAAEGRDFENKLFGETPAEVLAIPEEYRADDSSTNSATEVRNDRPILYT